MIAFPGDGSMSMGMGELATLAQEQLPVKIVVLRNNSLAIEVWEQNAMLGNPQFGCELALVDFAAVAEACGVRGYHVTEPADGPADALAHDGAALVMADDDPYEAPLADPFKPGQMQRLATAFERGEKARQAKSHPPTARDRWLWDMSAVYGRHVPLSAIIPGMDERLRAHDDAAGGDGPARHGGAARRGGALGVMTIAQTQRLPGSMGRSRRRGVV